MLSVIDAFQLVWAWHRNTKTEIQIQETKASEGLVLLLSLICCCSSSWWYWLALLLTVPNVSCVRFVPFCICVRENCVQWLFFFLVGHVCKCSCALNQPFSSTGPLVWKGSLSLARSDRTRNIGQQQYLPLAKCNWEEKMISWKWFHCSYLFSKLLGPNLTQ